MLYLIQNDSDKYLNFISHDPVRPAIPVLQRIGSNKDIFVLRDIDDSVNAVTCVSYQHDVPAVESELFNEGVQPKVAVFYTIWSYKPGAGRQLILDTVNYIKEHNSSIERFVTLSPKTEMARRFHLKNGAIVLRENTETVNYEYFR